MASRAVEELLEVMSNEEILQFYDELFEAIQSSSSGSDVAEGFTVASGIAGKGKGLIATRDFHRHEEILRERAFVALQSLGNRQKVLACANCFRFVGSVELQLAWRLMHMLEHEADSIPKDTAARMGRTAQNLISGKLKLPFQHICALPKATLCPGGCTEVYCSSRCCAEAWQKHHCLLCRGGAEVGTEMHLRNAQNCPYVREFEVASLQKFQHDRDRFAWITAKMPSVDAVSRSAKVAPPVNGISSLSLGADSLPQGPGAYATEAGPLLTSSSPAEAPQSAAQKRPPKPPIPPNGSLSNGSSRAETPSGSPRQMGLPKPPWIATNSNSDAYSQLVSYASKLEMDTALLLAQVVAQLMCATQHVAWLLCHGSAGCAPLDVHSEVALLHARRLLGSNFELDDPQDPTLLDACFQGVWRPLQAAIKKPFWYAVSVPVGVDADEYKAHVKVIVENCTQLNDAVMFDPRFPSLFTVNFATSILGMFELNCLGVTVESPVEDLRDEMRSTKKRDGSLGVNAQLKEHFRTTEAIFKLLGTTDVPCDGAAFYAIQSCLNHDNRPNCSCQKDIDDKDGAASLSTTRRVRRGEELTISYVGDVSQLDEETLRASLADYGIYS